MSLLMIIIKEVVYNQLNPMIIIKILRPVSDGVLFTCIPNLVVLDATLERYKSGSDSSGVQNMLLTMLLLTITKKLSSVWNISRAANESMSRFCIIRQALPNLCRTFVAPNSKFCRKLNCAYVALLPNLVPSHT